MWYFLMTNFTFQSGYIQIQLQDGLQFYAITFTFQSGYIQIQGTIPRWIASHFTFQSGYIQIYIFLFRLRL